MKHKIAKIILEYEPKESDFIAYKKAEAIIKEFQSAINKEQTEIASILAFRFVEDIKSKEITEVIISHLKGVVNGNT